MSRTDKTNPYWLKIARGDVYGSPLDVTHRCIRKSKWDRRETLPDCIIVVPLPMTRGYKRFENCELWVSAYDVPGRKVWGNRPDKATRKEMGFEGRNRMLLRQLRLRWKSEPLEDIDSTENAPRNKRHSHNRWHWD